MSIREGWSKKMDQVKWPFDKPKIKSSKERKIQTDNEFDEYTFPVDKDEL